MVVEEPPRSESYPADTLCLSWLISRAGGGPCTLTLRRGDVAGPLGDPSVLPEGVVCMTESAVLCMAWLVGKLYGRAPFSHVLYDQYDCVLHSEEPWAFWGDLQYYLTVGQSSCAVDDA